MKVKEQNSSLFKVCGNPGQFPPETMPEIAFAGKSNVGKSTLINMLLGRKGLARTSSVPGKTQTVNWYDIDHTLYFVDLPGYGYAKASQKEQERWGKTIENYLHKRETLKGVFLLVDSRHEPGKNDIMMMEWLKHYEIDTIVVATKSDKLGKSQLQRQKALIAKTLQISPDSVITASALSKDGRDTLWKQLLQMVQK